MGAIVVEDVPTRLDAGREHEGEPDEIVVGVVPIVPTVVAPHRVNGVAGVGNVIPGNDGRARQFEVDAVSTVGHRIMRDPNAVRIPYVNAVAALVLTGRFEAHDLVVSHLDLGDAVYPDSETTAFDGVSHDPCAG